MNSGVQLAAALGFRGGFAAASLKHPTRCPPSSRAAVLGDDRIRIEAGDAAPGRPSESTMPSRRGRSFPCPRFSRTTRLSFPAASSAMSLLTEMGIARELTGKRRHRLLIYDGYLALLNQGTERP